MAKEFIKDFTKLVTYPTLGNMSDNLKSRLEWKVGKEWFDSESATRTTFLTNTLLYSTTISILLYPAPLGPIITGSILYGVGLSSIENLIRDKMMDKNNSNPASLLGRLSSIPIEYFLNLYDRAKK